MPFNMAIASGGRRVIVLAALTVEDLALAYDVESEIASQFPALSPSRSGDLIQLTLGGVDFIASSSSGYAIDADGLDNGALFLLTLETGCWISGRGGNGGRGGFVLFNSPENGSPGIVGGLSIRFGCDTNILGTGDIERGYGGGGGGAGSRAPGPDVSSGGSGGGGGAPIGAGGLAGLGDDEDGNVGNAATNVDGGTGGASGVFIKKGGDGGDSVGGSQNGDNSSGASGGVGGADGDAIDSQAFTYNISGSVTVTGPII